MIRVAVGFLLLCGVVAIVGAARAGESPTFLEAVALEDGQWLVIAEPPLEPRSIGSYSVRLYSGANPEFPYDDFLAGLVLPRNGALERVCTQDGEPGEQQVVVTVRSAGSGGYLSGHRLEVRGATVTATPFQWGAVPRAPGEALPCPPSSG